MQRQHPVWKKTAMHYKVKKKTTKKPVETIPMGCAAQGQIKEIWSKLLSVLIFLKCLTPWWIKHPWLRVQPSCHEVGVVSLSHSENNLTGKKIDKARVSFLNLLPWFPRNLMRFCFRFHTQSPFRLLASRLWFLSLLFTAIPSTYNSVWHIWETPKSLLGVWVAWEEVICWLLQAYLSVHFILFHLPPAGQLHFLLALSHSLWRSLSHPRVKIETLSSGPLANILSCLIFHSLLKLLPSPLCPPLCWKDPQQGHARLLQTTVCFLVTILAFVQGPLSLKSFLSWEGNIALHQCFSSFRSLFYSIPVPKVFFCLHSKRWALCRIPSSGLSLLT